MMRSSHLGKGRHLSLGLVAVLALGTAWACGGDDSDGGSDSEAGAAGSAGSPTTGGGTSGGGTSGGGAPSSAGEAGVAGEPSAGGEPGSAGETGSSGSAGEPSGASGSGGEGETGGETSAGTAGEAGGDGGPSGPIDLSSDDFPEDGPCPSQDLLTDEDAFAALKAALTDGSIVYMDVPYDGGDSAIFDKKCGRPGAFDPAIYVNMVPVTGGDPDLSDIVDFQNGGICADGFDASSFGSGEGFPSAGTYRKEFRAALEGTTYQLRARMQASGSEAGSIFSDAGLSHPGAADELVYEVNSTEVDEADLWDELVNGMTASGTSLPAVTLDVSTDTGEDPVFTTVIELVCAAEMD